MVSCRRVTCVYGSVTGKAQSIAEQLVQTADGRGIKVDLFCFDTLGTDWNIPELDILLIVSSTTGDGEQPENVTKFWRKLRSKSLPDTHLKHVNFAILGLGDTNYNQFCNAPRKIRKRLLELGGNEIYPAGWADDGVGLELVVEPWLDGLWPLLTQMLKGTIESETCGSEETVLRDPPSSDRNAEQEKLTDPPSERNADSEKFPSLRASGALRDLQLDLPKAPHRYILVEMTDRSPTNYPYQNGSKLPFSSGEIQTAVVVANDELSATDSVKTYMEMVLEPSTPFTYAPGDSFAVICQNNDEDVATLLERLGFNGDETCLISVMTDTKKSRAKVPDYVPAEINLRVLLKTCLDLRSPPKKLFMRALAEVTEDPEERRRLEELCSKQGSTEYTQLVQLGSLSFIELIREFVFCKPPLSLLIENLPRLLPRPYSFSSSPLADAGRLSFVYTVVDSPRPGLATSWLRRRQPDARVEIYPRVSSGFQAPTIEAASYLMVCAGSGIGPFLGFLEDRKLRQMREGKVWLVFGCRNKDKDFIHRDRLEGFVRDGFLSKLTVAFSRDEENGGVKYVQDALLSESEEVRRLVHQDQAHIFVCGDAKNMGRCVNEALAAILTTTRGDGTTEDDGAAILKTLVAEKRYKQDLWT